MSRSTPILSYRTNVALDLEFQAWFRAHKPPLLARWGRIDPFFIPPGAEGYRRDLPDAGIHVLDTGHFALETHAAETARPMRGVLERESARD